MVDSASESFATPHDTEARSAVEALAVPVEASVVVAEEDELEERGPAGTGDPVGQTDELALTTPPAPVPVE
ncbi:MAG: hypothetical protein ABSA14_15690 [Acidimicrobiales bacterium]